jgi:hypothetical protein
MKREPSIHITESVLLRLIREFYDFDDLTEEHAMEMRDYIMSRAYKYSLESRQIQITNQKIADKVLNKVVDDKTDISLLSTLIYSIRKDLKHRGIKPINNNSAEWTQLKKLTNVVNEFCNEFELSKREGYITYIRNGLKKISSYRGYITKLYDMSESLSNEYQASIEIKEDKNSKLTYTLHNYYIGKIAIKTGMKESFLNNPLDYVIFVRLSEKLVEMKVKPEQYIDAQFEGLGWTGNYPEPSQLLSDKAIGRLNKYLYNQKKDNPEDKPKKDMNLVETLKNIKHGKNRD